MAQTIRISMSAQPRTDVVATMLLPLLVMALACGLSFALGARKAVAEEAAIGFVGSQACAECHEAEVAAWRGSHHALAMQRADPRTVLGRFDGSSFERDGAKSVFSKKDEGYVIRTQGPDGKDSDFDVKFAFGVYPLQQYLLELPGGRLQAFGLAWDARPAELGGQRWFDLYPGRKLGPGDPLHWTGVDQNWNFQCAWCHTTDLKKNYDGATNAFRTRWAETGVGCESCHGPASNHLTWARMSETQRANAALKGFSRSLDERRGVNWPLGNDGQAHRAPSRVARKEVFVCAGCHARRTQFSDDPHAVADFYDAFRPALLETPLYHSDGQQKEEVFEFGSFLQSKMYAAGVTCSDCHDPHSGKLRASGDAICGQCHAPARFAQTSHHHHAPDSEGAKCVRCHMPATVYMGVDARRDHSLRIPRPDRTTTLGAPNACDGCHGDKAPDWAGDAMATWGSKPQGYQSFAEPFAHADAKAVGSSAVLTAIVDGMGQSALARASALDRLKALPSPQSISLAARALAIKDPLVRLASIGVLAEADAEIRRRTLAPLLSDETRLVRMEAARALAGEAERGLTNESPARFEAALQEYIDAQLFNAERAEAHANLGALYRDRQQLEKSRSEYAKALDLDRTFFPSAIALAELSASSGDEPGGEAILRKALATNATVGALHHALGLSLIRQRQLGAATIELANAAKLEPATARFAYVYAVALHDTGEKKQARTTLEAALTHSPNDRDLLLALASYEAEDGDLAAANAHATLLSKIVPDDPEVAEFVQSLNAAKN